MLIVKDKKVINLYNVCYFCKIKDEYRISIKFYFPTFDSDSGYQEHILINYESESQRDIDYCKIIEAYKMEYRICDL